MAWLPPAWLFCLAALTVGLLESNSSATLIRALLITPFTWLFDVAALGKSVALIEKSPPYWGGDCTWWGCVPSKTLIATAKTAHTVRSAHEYGVSDGGTGKVDVDMKMVKAQFDNLTNIEVIDLTNTEVIDLTSEY